MKLSVEQISRENEEEVIISRHIMLSTFFMCLLFNPASQLPVVSFFGRCIRFTLVCMATLVVYYSSRTDFERLVDSHNLACGSFGSGFAAPCTPLGILVRSTLDAIIYASFILAAKILWHLVNFGQSIRTATQINEQLLRRQNGQKQGGV